MTIWYNWRCDNKWTCVRSACSNNSCNAQHAPNMSRTFAVVSLFLLNCTFLFVLCTLFHSLTAIRNYVERIAVCNTRLVLISLCNACWTRPPRVPRKDHLSRSIQWLCETRGSNAVPLQVPRPFAWRELREVHHKRTHHCCHWLHCLLERKYKLQKEKLKYETLGEAKTNGHVCSAIVL